MFKARKNLYLSMIRSTLMYCSSLWRPYLITDIELLEKVQKRATKYILNGCYKQRLLRLEFLPLMYIYDLADIMFFVKSVKFPSKFDFIEFISGPTTSAGYKLRHKTASTNSTTNSYFFRIPRLWNGLPISDSILSDY